MTLELSKKIKVISFLCIIMIVFLHSYNISANYSNKILKLAPNDINVFIQNYISDGITRIAVPMFFLLSGYLFFINIELYDRKAYTDKLHKRGWSLLVPYLFWNAWGIFVFFLLQSIPASSEYFIKNIVRDFSIQDLLYHFLWDPLPYQFWFIRDLILLVVITPLIYFCLKKTGIPFLVFLLILWAINFNLFKIISIEGILFFSIGSYLGINKHNLAYNVSCKATILLFLLWLIIIFVNIYFYPSVLYLKKIAITTGIFFFWLGYDRLTSEKIKDILFKFTGFTFFLFAFHEPGLTILKKILLKIFGVSTLINFLSYIIAPLIIIFFSISIAYLLKKYTSSFYKIISGGR
jgi:surface polysaccharide O-acyltransferase-like enzyme